MFISRVQRFARQPNSCHDTGVCERYFPSEKKTFGSISSNNTKSWGGEQFMSFLCKAKARRKEMFVSQTPVFTSLPNIRKVSI